MNAPLIDRISDRVTNWVGSTSSIVVHTIFFILAMLTHWLFGSDFSDIFLVLTTIVSLEAIYISIFIQRAVNQQATRLDNVEESIDEVEETLEDVEEALDDVEEALDDAEEDIEAIAGDTVKKLEEPMDEILDEMKKILKEFKSTMRTETPKKEKKQVPETGKDQA